VQNSNPAGFKLELTNKGELNEVRSADAEWTTLAAIDLPATPLIKLSYDDQSALSSLAAEKVQGKVVITEIPDYRTQPRERRREVFVGMRQFMERMAQLKPALIVSVSREALLAGPKGRLIDPEHRQQGRGLQAPGPIITIHGARTAKFYDDLKAADTGATVSAHIAADVEQPVKVRNIVGLLRGSDPKLNKTYVLVTAHYDHLGISGTASGDRIYNGANDDGSGTVSVIELASALATLKARPRRSILFMAFFGEEKGELGSRYYGAHPIFPIGDTVADINLEQVGRTDSTEGPKIASASMTGYDFSDIGEIFKQAGKQVGIDVYKHPVNSDAYFGRSDNQALAYQGVPAHTLCVAFDYPDYHGVGDEWPKVDYENMAKVDRMVGLGLLIIADSEKTPEWNQGNPKASQYVKAWQAHHNAVAAPSGNH
ncbi:MAG: M28 family peptidase, partial [Blastocatellia bacterium]